MDSFFTDKPSQLPSKNNVTTGFVIVGFVNPEITNPVEKSYGLTSFINKGGKLILIMKELLKKTSKTSYL